DIRPLIEAHASAANPVDLTFDLGMRKLAVTLPEMIMKSGEVDALILHGIMHSGFMVEIFEHLRDYLQGVSYEAFLKGTRSVKEDAFQLPGKYPFPFLISSFFDDTDDCTRGYLDAGVPVFRSPENAARALGSLHRCRLIRERVLSNAPPLSQAQPAALEILGRAKAEGRGALDECEAKQVLAAYGVPVTREVKAVTCDDAVEAAKQIRYPVAVKACSWEILHKSGRGLIALNLKKEAQVQEAFDGIQKAAGKPTPVLVQEMVFGSREFLVGMTRFPGFAPCVVFGLGGVWTEIHRDMTLRQSPLSDSDAAEMLADLRSSRLLGEYRGMPEVKRGALAGILQAVGTIALLHPEIAEIDINPVMIRGDEPVAADALIGLKAED
ncbi:MAG: acetate--CoA ligase family protein, partial [Smithellaceae bacterium]